MTGREARKIPGFPGYFATAGGKVISRKRGPQKGLSPRAHHRTGHLRVRLYSKTAPLRLAGGTTWGNKPRKARYADMYVHVIVCLAWHGKPPAEGLIVLHRDDDPTNNRPENLRWGTYKENAADRHMDNDEQQTAAEESWAQFHSDDDFDWSTGEYV